MIIFVSGGARSGKSSFAEQLVTKDAYPSHLHYIATSRVTDSEMKSRIEHHRERRTDEWITWEKPTDIGELATKVCSKDHILIDCLTLLTANELFKGSSIQSPDLVLQTILTSVQKFSHVKLLVLVSNDLFSDIMPDDQGTIIYLKLLGSLHQEIVSLADEAYQVLHGIPLKMKG